MFCWIYLFVFKYRRLSTMSLSLAGNTTIISLERLMLWAASAANSP